MSTHAVPRKPTDDVRYEPVAGWGSTLPEMHGRDVPDVMVSESDEVHLLYRDPPMVVVCDREGRLLRTIGSGVVTRPHGVTTSPDYTYVVDEAAHVVRAFGSDGLQAMVVGDGPSDPTFPAGGLHIDLITRPLPPFTRPTRIAVARWGDLYVSDGYGNCRIHRFRRDGTLIHSWGEPGTAGSQFHIPHSVVVDSDDRVIVCDRENDRIQLFSPDGELIAIWSDLHRPQDVAEGRDGLLYVAEGAWGDNHVSPVHGPVGAAPSRISVLDRSGQVVQRIGGEPADAPAAFISAHGIGIDSLGDLYVVECLASLFAATPGLADPGRAAVHKLRRTAG